MRNVPINPKGFPYLNTRRFPIKIEHIISNKIVECGNSLPPERYIPDCKPTKVVLLLIRKKVMKLLNNPLPGNR